MCKRALMHSGFIVLCLYLFSGFPFWIYLLIPCLVPSCQNYLKSHILLDCKVILLATIRMLWKLISNSKCVTTFFFYHTRWSLKGFLPCDLLSKWGLSNRFCRTLLQSKAHYHAEAPRLNSKNDARKSKRVGSDLQFEERLQTVKRLYNCLEWFLSCWFYIYAYLQQLSSFYKIKFVIWLH